MAGTHGAASALCAVWVVCLWAIGAGASPDDLWGAGAESRARAGGGASFVRSGHAARLNPASLSSVAASQLQVGWSASQWRLKLPGRSESGSSGTWDVALAAPLKLLPSLPIGLGLRVAAPGARIARVDLRPSGEAQSPLLGPRAQTLNMAIGLGLAPTPTLRVGAGVQLLASVAGQIQIEAGGSGQVSSITDDSLHLTAAPVLGILWSPSAALAGALVWRGAVTGRFDLTVNVTDLDPVVVPPLNIAGLPQYDPEQLELELSWQSDALGLALGVTWKRWSLLKRLIEATVVCPDTEEDCEALDSPPLLTHDTVLPRLSAWHNLALSRSVSLQLRGGYLFESSPLPPATDGSLLFDNDRHVLSIGYSTFWGQLGTGRAFSAALAYQLHLAAERTHGSGLGSSRGHLHHVSAELGVPF